MAYRLLFVEDDRGQVDLFKGALDEWNRRNPSKIFNLEVATTAASGREILANSQFDGALLDLKLPGAEELPGQTLAEICVRQRGMPAAIVSGNPADFDASTFDGMLAVYNKGDTDAYENAVQWFGNLCGMMKVLQATRTTIQKMGADVFSKRVWPRWKLYEELLSGINEKELTSIVTRQYTSHIADMLGLDSAGNAKWHPIENYISPALQETRPHTGDIFQFDGVLWVVLTPQCDMATKKASSVLLASCDARPDLKEWKENVARLADPKKKEKAEVYFRKLVNQLEPALHFLPPLENGQPLMVDFKKLMTLPLEELQKRLAQRRASVATPFLTNLTQRFGAYISRVGQPDIDVSHFD